MILGSPSMWLGLQWTKQSISCPLIKCQARLSLKYTFVHFILLSPIPIGWKGDRGNWTLNRRSCCYNTQRDIWSRAIAQSLLSISISFNWMALCGKGDNKEGNVDIRSKWTTAIDYWCCHWHFELNNWNEWVTRIQLVSLFNINLFAQLIRTNRSSRPCVCTFAISVPSFSGWETTQSVWVLLRKYNSPAHQMCWYLIMNYRPDKYTSYVCR